MNRSQARSQVRDRGGYFDAPNFEAVNASQSASRRGVVVDGRVDRFERRRDCLAVLVVHEPHRGTEQVHGAGLHHRLGPARLDGLGEPGQPVAAHDQHVPDPAVAQLGADPGPELGALGGLHPDAQHVLDPVQVHPDRDVRGLVPDLVPVADLDHQGVQVDDGVELFQRPGLPGLDLLGDRVGDVGDRVVGQLGPDRAGQVMLDVADRHPAGIEADDHLVEAPQAT